MLVNLNSPSIFGARAARGKEMFWQKIPEHRNVKRLEKNVSNFLHHGQTLYFSVIADSLMGWMIEVWKSRFRVINTIEDIQITATLWKQDYWTNVHNSFSLLFLSSVHFQLCHCFLKGVLRTSVSSGMKVHIGKCSICWPNVWRVRMVLIYMCI